MSNKLLNLDHPLFEKLRTIFTTIADTSDICYGLISPENNEAFLLIREWNVTTPDYKATFGHTEENLAWTQQSFNMFLRTQLYAPQETAFARQNYLDAVRSLESVYKYFTEQGASAFDTRVSISKGCINLRISFVKESDWVSQTIYSVEFTWSKLNLKSWDDSLLDTLAPKPFKIMTHDNYGRIVKVNFLNPHTLEVYQNRTYNWSAKANGVEQTQVSVPIADLDQIYSSSTDVGNGGVRSVYLGKFFGHLVEVTDTIKGDAKPNV